MWSSKFGLRGPNLGSTIFKNFEGSIKIVHRLRLLLRRFLTFYTFVCFVNF